ncbi:MAG: hypothetical protein ACKN9J_04555, partial [Holophagaceae bacterium]
LGSLVRAGDAMKLKAKAYLEIANEAWCKKYDHTGVFSKVLAAVELYVREGFVDKTGNEY